jgi:hypothetical protein
VCTEKERERGTKREQNRWKRSQDSGDVVTERVLDRDGEDLDTRDGGHTTYE